MTSTKILRDLLDELRQLSLQHKLNILWFVLQVRIRRRIANLSGRILNLRLTPAAVAFLPLEPMIRRIVKVVLVSAPSPYQAVVEIADFALIALLLQLIIKFFHSP
jgi:protein gp37